MSQKLINAIDEVKDLPEVTLGTIVDRIGDEAALIVCLICILPFMQPIPIPGVSSLLGFVVFLQGISLIFKGKPLLTKSMRNIVLHHDRLALIHKAAIKFTRVTEKLSVLKHPAISSRGPRLVSGITIMFAAAFLSLPLPIPFSNFIPAISIFFICAGLLESDLVLVVFGHAIAATIIWMIVASSQIIGEKFQSWF
jgi:hypothetical protein